VHFNLGALLALYVMLDAAVPLGRLDLRPLRSMICFVSAMARSTLRNMGSRTPASSPSLPLSFGLFHRANAALGSVSRMARRWIPCGPPRLVFDEGSIAAWPPSRRPASRLPRPLLWDGQHLQVTLEALRPARVQVVHVAGRLRKNS